MLIIKLLGLLLLKMKKTGYEKKNGQKEALSKFKGWNQSTSPKFCMTDYFNN